MESSHTREVQGLSGAFGVVMEDGERKFSESSANRTGRSGACVCIVAAISPAGFDML